MTYRSWFDAHAYKHKKIVDKLVAKNYTQKQIIEYFEFDNMVKSENDFCLLYRDRKKCHKIKKLNCYFCACPHFLFNDAGIKQEGEFTVYSECTIAKGDTFKYGNKIHHDCSNCIIPHKKAYSNFIIQSIKI
jgi:Zn-finger protein